MAIDQGAIVGQIDLAIANYKEARKRAQYDDLSDLPKARQAEILTLLAATVDRLAPPDSRYRQNADAALKKYGSDNAHNIQILLGILWALRAAYIAGHLVAVQELIQSELFADFLEMAHYLLEQGYKDPAAVLIGGVLEEHMRKLCERNGIGLTVNDRPKKAEGMNADLAAANAYGKLDQKSVTAWLDLRNKAAHGQYDGYTREQVQLMLQGVRDFIVRTLSPRAA